MRFLSSNQRHHFVAADGPLPPQQFATGASVEQHDIAGEKAYWRDWHPDFDYLFRMGFGQSTPPGDPRLTPVARGGFFLIDRIRHP